MERTKQVLAASWESLTIRQVGIEQLDVRGKVGQVSIGRHERVDLHRAVEAVVDAPRVAGDGDGGDGRAGGGDWACAAVNADPFTLVRYLRSDYRIFDFLSLSCNHCFGIEKIAEGKGKMGKDLPDHEFVITSPRLSSGVGRREEIVCDIGDHVGACVGPFEG